MNWGSYSMETGTSAGVRLLDETGREVVSWLCPELGVPQDSYVDADEWEKRWSWAGVQITIRCHVHTELTVRIVVENNSRTMTKVPVLDSILTPGPDRYGWIWAADATGGWSVAPLSGEQPQLVATLTSGFLGSEDPRRRFVPQDQGALLPGFEVPVKQGLAQGRLQLTPTGLHLPAGHRYVSQWTLSWCDVEVPFQTRNSGLGTCAVRRGETITLSDLDAAVVPGPGVDAVTTDEGVELRGLPGHREVWCHGRRGVTRLQLVWEPDADRVISARAEDLVRMNPRQAASHHGVIVARAMAQHSIAEEAALDWLESQDWLARADRLGLVVAAMLATQTGDGALCEQVLAADDVLYGDFGDGLVALWVSTAALATGSDASALLLAVRNWQPTSTATAVELACIDRLAGIAEKSHMRAMIGRLGFGGCGQPLGMTALWAIKAANVLALCPHTWPIKSSASHTSAVVRRQILADCSALGAPADELLAWWIVGAE